MKNKTKQTIKNTTVLVLG